MAQWHNLLGSKGIWIQQHDMVAMESIGGRTGCRTILDGWNGAGRVCLCRGSFAGAVGGIVTYICELALGRSILANEIAGLAAAATWQIARTLCLV